MARNSTSRLANRLPRGLVQALRTRLFTVERDAPIYTTLSELERQEGDQLILRRPTRIVRGSPPAPQPGGFS